MRLLIAILCLVALTTKAFSDEKNPITLKLVNKAEKYKFDGGGLNHEKYKKELEETAKNIKDNKKVLMPKSLDVDLVLQLTNTSKEKVTIGVEGDSNVYNFELTVDSGKDAGVVTMRNNIGFTAQIRGPRSITLEPGKSHEIPVKELSDGFRGRSRLFFWIGPGEYKLQAKYNYTVAKKNFDLYVTVKSEPVKITVVEK